MSFKTIFRVFDFCEHIDYIAVFLGVLEVGFGFPLFIGEHRIGTAGRKLGIHRRQIFVEDFTLRLVEPLPEELDLGQGWELVGQVEHFEAGVEVRLRP